MDDPSKAAAENDSKNGVPAWVQATLADIRDLGFEGPIADTMTAEPEELSTLYRKAAHLHEELGDEDAAPAARVFGMLASVMGLHFKPEDRHEPYGAMLISSEGRRSALPEDFRGEPAAVLAYAAERADNPVLQARLSDLSWLLDRSQVELGRAAVAAYVDIIDKLETGALKAGFEQDDGASGLTGRDILRRAHQIGRITGLDDAAVVAAREWVVKLRKRAIDRANFVRAHWFAEMDLDFGISEPAEVAADLEKLLRGTAVGEDAHGRLELWRLAARAYHYAKDEEGKYRCETEAAEGLVAAAEAALEKQGSAMLAAHWLSAAVAEYHGIPGKRERRTALRHKLIDIQAGIPDEMSSYAQTTDIREIVQYAEKRMEGLDLLDALLVFADLERSPEPEKLIQDAMKSIMDHPLSSLFGATYHDTDGRVIHRTEGAGVRDAGNESAVQAAIARHEQIRRALHATGQVDVAQRRIVERHYLSDDTFIALLRHSPFLPNDRVQTFARGFTRFFQGDFISALYILTPLMENSLRHLLKLNGHDVTTFDDALQIQKERSITSLFDGMRPELDAILGTAITTDINNVFISRPGPSLRHEVAHGLLHDGSPYGPDAIYGCWLIFRLCCIPLFRHRDKLKLA